jgi:hypothetical protein
MADISENKYDNKKSANKNEKSFQSSKLSKIIYVCM